MCTIITHILLKFVFSVQTCVQCHDFKNWILFSITFFVEKIFKIVDNKIVHIWYTHTNNIYTLFYVFSCIFFFVCSVFFFSTMKATTWLCPVFTLLCATKLVYTAQKDSYGGGYPLNDIDSQNLQVSYLVLVDICHKNISIPFTSFVSCPVRYSSFWKKKKKKKFVCN